MALITPSSLVSEIRGSAGTLTYSKNKYRSYVKNRVAPTDTPSDYKTTARTNLSNAVNAWKSLTSAQRQQWNTEAQNFNSRSRLGQTKPLSGYNYFVRFSILAQYAGLEIPTMPEAQISFPTFSYLVFHAFAGNISFDVQPTFTDERFVLHLYASGPQEQTIESVNSTQMVWLKSQSLSAGLSVADMTEAWESRFGATTDYEHKRVFAGVKIMDTLSGAISPMIIQNDFIDGEAPPAPVWPSDTVMNIVCEFNVAEALTFCGINLDLEETDEAITFTLYVSAPQIANSPTPDFSSFSPMVVDEPAITQSTTYDVSTQFVDAFGEASDYIGQYVWACIVFNLPPYSSDPEFSTPAQIELT